MKPLLYRLMRGQVPLLLDYSRDFPAPRSRLAFRGKNIQEPSEEPPACAPRLAIPKTDPTA